MTTIAELGIRVDSGDAVEAATDLEKLAQASEKAEKAAGGMASSFDSASSSAGALSAAEGRVAESAEEAMARLTAMAKASLEASDYHKSLAASLTGTSTALGAAGSKATDWAAYQAEVNARGRALIETEDRLAESVRQAAAATGIQGDGLQALLGKINPALAALDKLDQQQADLQKYRSAGLLDGDTFREYNTRIEASRQKLGEFDEGLRKTGTSSAQTEQALRQLPAQFTDIFTSLAGGQNPLMVLIQQGGQIKDSFGGVEETFDALKSKFLSLFSGGAGAADLGASLYDMASSSKEVADNASEAGESLSGLAEQTNTAAEAAGNAKTAIDAVGPSVSAASISFWSIAAAVAASAAAIGTLIYGYSQGSKEADEFNRSLILTGNYAGTSAAALGDMARRVSDVNGTTGQAAAILANLAGNGEIASESFEMIANAAVAMEDATGKSVDATVAEFIKIAGDPVKAAKELNDQYHFLRASVYSQIVALKEQGDTIGATNLLAETYADTIQGRTGEITDNLGLIESAWKDIKDSAAGALDAVLDVGRAFTLEEQIADVDRRIAMTEQGGFGLSSDKERSLVALRDQRTFLEDQKAAAAELAAYDKEQAKSQKDAISAMSRVDALTKSAWNNEKKRAEEIKKYRKDLDAIRKADPSDARLDKDVIAGNIANIERKYKDPQARRAEVDLTSFNDQKNALNAILAEYKNHQKELDAAQKAGLISQESYAAQRAAIIEQQKAEVTNAYEAEIKALEDAKGRSSTSAQQRIQLDQKIADARAAMVKAQKDADTELSVLATNEQGRLARQERAITSYVQALEQQQRALELAGQRAVVGVGRGDRQNALNGELNTQQDRYAQQVLDLENQRSDPSRNMSEAEFERKSQALASANKKATDQIQQNYADVEAAQGDWTKGASAAWENYLDGAKNIAGQTKTLFGNAFSSMEDSIVNFAMTGKASFADFAKSIIADMARIAARQAASGLLGGLVNLGVSAASAYFGGGSGNGMEAGSAGAVSSNLGASQAGYGSAYFPQALGGAWSQGVQMFADGGAFTNSIVSKPTAFGIAGGRMGVMGEAGDEAVMPLTRTAGGQLGVRAVGGGGGTSISMPMSLTLVTEDRSGEGMQLDQQALQQNMQAQMKAAGEKAVADSWRPGGISYRNSQGRR